jgi:hypothetical protein
VHVDFRCNSIVVRYWACYKVLSVRLFNLLLYKLFSSLVVLLVYYCCLGRSIFHVYLFMLLFV